MRIRLIALAIFFCLLPIQVHSSAEATDAERGKFREVTTKCMAYLSGAQSEDACQELFIKYWYQPTEGLKTIEGLKKILAAGAENAESVAGKRLEGSHEFACSQRTGESIEKLVYIIKHEYTPFPFAFKFYKADRWILVGVAFGDQAGSALDSCTVPSSVNK